MKTLPFMQSSLLWQGAKGILSPMETIDQDASLYDLIETRFGEDMAKYLGKGLKAPKDSKSLKIVAQGPNVRVGIRWFLAKIQTDQSRFSYKGYLWNICS